MNAYFTHVITHAHTSLMLISSQSSVSNSSVMMVSFEQSASQIKVWRGQAL